MAGKLSGLSGLAIAAVFAIELAACPAMAAPVVVNADFANRDDGLNAAYNDGKPFWLVGWNPVGFASNSAADPGQYDNGAVAGGVVGFLSGPGTSLSQVVNGFTPGSIYQIDVAVAGRYQVIVRPVMNIFVDGVEVFGPSQIGPVDALFAFNQPFTPVHSSAFVATNSAMTVTLANDVTSPMEASTLLTRVSVTLIGPLATVTIPEPVSMMLLGTALIGLGATRRRA